MAWPGGEFLKMGLEAAVRLGFKRELEALEDANEGAREFKKRVADISAHGTAANVVDPADLHRRLADVLVY